MSEVVYLLGAGFNQAFTNVEGLKPPLANNLFQIVLQSDKFGREAYSEELTPVYNYIAQYWKKSKEDLRNEPFDLEECFTVLQLQQNQAKKVRDYKEYKRLWDIEFLLTHCLAEILQEFEKWPTSSSSMRKFGQAVYQQKPIVITLNYDCILESSIEHASGVKGGMNKRLNRWEKFEIPDDEISYSFSNWNRPLAYGVKFDRVQLHFAAVPNRYINKSRFYNHPENKLYPWKILKLHGSLNWFQFSNTPSHYSPFDNSNMKLPEEKKGEVLLIHGYWWLATPPDFEGWRLNPLIITPVLYKERFYRHSLFEKLWKQALKELSNCKRLVVIGYSFAPTDFNIRKLLLDAFCDNSLEDLVIVNPDTSVVKTVKELTHFQKPVLVCRDLDEYLSYLKIVEVVTVHTA